MAIEIKEVTSAKDYKDFVNVQFDIYKGNDYWVPPLKKDEIKALQAEHNPAYRFCTAKFWNAYKDGKCVGRIGGIINKMYNESISQELNNIFVKLNDWLAQLSEASTGVVVDSVAVECAVELALSVILSDGRAA